MLFEDAKFNFEVIVVSKESIRERSSFCIAILFEIEDQLSFVVRFEDSLFFRSLVIFCDPDL